jgi:hypothetical protein
MFVGLEVKSEKGKMRPSQIAFQSKVEATGGKYFVVRSLMDAKSALMSAMIGSGYSGYVSNELLCR